MYSMQLPTSLPSSPTISWVGHGQGWNTSSWSSTAVNWFQQPSPPWTVIHINVGANNASAFTPDSAEINLGDVLRFHLPAMNCSLVQTFDHIQANVSLEHAGMGNRVLNPVNMNGSLIFDYLVDIELPQWVYPEHPSSCGSSGLFMIAPHKGVDTGKNSTQNHTKPSSTVTSTLQEFGTCGSDPQTVSSVGNGYNTGISTDASVSPTVHLPLATSLTPENISKASKLLSSSPLALLVVVYVFPFITKLP